MLFLQLLHPCPCHGAWSCALLSFLDLTKLEIQVFIRPAAVCCVARRALLGCWDVGLQGSL